jgi:DNA polymerase-3 subunit chi
LTEIDFHFGVPAPQAYACRLVRKALRSGASVAVTGPADLLDALDRELWSFEAEEFVPHARAERALDVPASLHATTAWLAAEPEAVPAHDVLVNLGATVPRGFEAFRRLIEIVPNDDAGKTAARSRWKGYAGRGYAIRSHAVGSEGVAP